MAYNEFVYGTKVGDCGVIQLTPRPPLLKERGREFGVGGNYVDTVSTHPPAPSLGREGVDNLGWVEITWIPFQLTPRPPLLEERGREFGVG
jgi:hypothetical protein